MSFTDEETQWENTPTEWKATGVEPATELKEKGFQAGYKPPADFFNHLFNKIYVSIKEMQKKVATRVEIQTELDKKANSTHTHNYAGSDSAGGAATSAIKDSNGNTISDTYAKKTEVVTNNNILADINIGLSGKGWYRIAKFYSTANLVVEGSCVNSCNIFIKRYWSNNKPEYHEITLASVYNKIQFIPRIDISETQRIGKIRYTVDNSEKTAYIEVYWAGDMSDRCIIGIEDCRIHSTWWESITPELTQEKVDGITIHTTCDIPANCGYVLGGGVKASGAYSLATGYYTEALQNQHAQGHYNDTTIALANSTSGTSDGAAFVIGNGTSTAKSNAFQVTGKGVVYSKGAYNSTGADYAEFAEWADGNPNNEDRRGYFVTFDEEKTTMIRKANAGDYVLGIVSGNPCIIGNADEGWLGKYIFDEFGSIVYEDVEVEETYTDETGEEKTRIVKVNTYKINPEYDATREYIHREKRKEWAAIGWIGVLSVRDDNTCTAGGYCKVTDGGIATAAERGIDTYRVLERVTDNIVKVAIK